VHFSQRITAPVPIQTAWDFIWQPQNMARCLPGCTGVDEIIPNEKYRAHIEDHIGPYTVHVALDVSVQETQPPKLIRTLATGDDPRLGLSQRIDLSVALRELGPQQTALDIEAEVEVTGAIAALGGFLVKRKAGDIVNQLARNIDAALRRAARTGGPGV
jgi:carbon monoxide dehydrogenase subunit G